MSDTEKVNVVVNLQSIMIEIDPYILNKYYEGNETVDAIVAKLVIDRINSVDPKEITSSLVENIEGPDDC